MSLIASGRAEPSPTRPWPAGPPGFQNSEPVRLALSIALARTRASDGLAIRLRIIERHLRGGSVKLEWEIERQFAEDGARPVIFYPRGGTCRQPWVKGLTIMVSSIYNGWRDEDASRIVD
jgi:hypothetical protein